MKNISGKFFDQEQAQEWETLDQKEEEEKKQREL